MRKTFLKIFFTATAIVLIFFTPGLSLNETLARVRPPESCVGGTIDGDACKCPEGQEKEATGGLSNGYSNQQCVPKGPGLLQKGLNAVVSSVLKVGIDFFAKMVAFFTTIATSFLALFLILVQIIAGWMIDLQYQIVKSPTVEVGWQIVRDIANSFFVLILIIMAFATILRIQSYGMKQLLWKLIVAAVLINFSFLIASVFIDFTNTITKYFITESTGTGGDSFKFASKLAGSFASPQSILKTNQIINLEETIEILVNIIFGALFAIIYMLTIILVILALAMLLFIRYIALSFLVILAPLAWLFWVVPEFSGHTKSWWSTFLKWCFFAPAAAFFIFLSTQIVGGGKNCGYFSSTNNCNSALQARADSADIQKGLMTEDLLANFGQMILNMGLLLGSLIVAQKMGIEGSNMAMALAKKPSTWLQNKTKAGVGRVRDRAATSRLAQGAARGAANVMSKIPGLRGAALGIAGAAGTARDREDAHWNKKYKGITTQRQFDNLAKAASSPAQAAALARLGQEKKFLGAKESVLDENDTRKLGRLLSQPEDKRAQQRLFTSTPTMAAEFAEPGKELEAVAKIASTIYDTTNLVAKELKLEEGNINEGANAAKLELALNFTPSASRDISEKGGEKTEAFKTLLETAWGQLGSLKAEQRDRIQPKLQRQIDLFNSHFINAGNRILPEGYMTPRERERAERKRQRSSGPATGGTPPPPSATDSPQRNDEGVNKDSGARNIDL